MPTTAAERRRCAHTPTRRPFICRHRSYIRGKLKRERAHADERLEERQRARVQKRGIQMRARTYVHRCYSSTYLNLTHIYMCGYPHTHAIINVNRYRGCAIASCPLLPPLLLLLPPLPLPPLLSAQATGMRAVEAVATVAVVAVAAVVAMVKAMIESGRRLRRRWGWFYGHTAMWCFPGVYCLT